MLRQNYQLEYQHLYHQELTLQYLFVDPSEQNVVQVSVTYFRTVFWAYPFLGSIFLYRNALQGMGYGLVPMLGGVFELVARTGIVLLVAGKASFAGVCLSDPAAWISALIPLVKDAKCDVVVCTPAVDFAAVSEVIKGTNIKLGAENMHWKESGAYTGELSAAMLKESGVEYVILGHSERRQYFGETNETVNKRVRAALDNGLKVILCVGEVLEEREQGVTFEVVGMQTKIALQGVSEEELKNVIIAYEPVWAIGTGKTATAEQAQEIHAFIRSLIAEKYGKEIADNCSILYGGSCKPSNAKELFANPDVDGGLIGGAALKVSDFKGIIDAFN